MNHTPLVCETDASTEVIEHTETITQVIDRLQKAPQEHYARFFREGDGLRELEVRLIDGEYRLEARLADGTAMTRYRAFYKDVEDVLEICWAYYEHDEAPDMISWTDITHG